MQQNLCCTEIPISQPNLLPEDASVPWRIRGMCLSSLPCITTDDDQLQFAYLRWKSQGTWGNNGGRRLLQRPAETAVSPCLLSPQVDQKTQNSVGRPGSDGKASVTLDPGSSPWASKSVGEGLLLTRDHCELSLRSPPFPSWPPLVHWLRSWCQFSQSKKQ